jgi:hypothetical protein
MSDFDSNNQAGGDQSAQAGAAGYAAAGQASPAASFNTNVVQYVPPTPLTLQQVINMQASPSLSAEQEPTRGLTDAQSQGY